MSGGESAAVRASDRPRYAADWPPGVADWPLGAADWRTRPETPSDREAVDAVLRDAFPTAEEALLVDRLRGDTAWIEGLSYVAVDDADAVVAHALLTRCHIAAAPGLCLAPCAVQTRSQGRGAGTAVITAVLTAARARGERWVVVLGHPEYYPRFGFVPAADHGIRVSIDVPDGALMVLSLSDDAVIPAGTVRYAAPFGI